MDEEYDNLAAWVHNHLKPKGKPAQRAHQFTINGVTYPFISHYHYAALPFPEPRRLYSLMANLYLTRPGDLVYFFQSDPQWESDIDSRRGLRGIFQVVSEPFHDPKPIPHPQDADYIMHGRCPNCGAIESSLSGKCPACEIKYPSHKLPNRKDYYHLVLPCRLELEPLAVFKRAVSDERAYGDMTDQGMIWVGRHDNQMGPGKGSSVRQLLPDEAVKITRLLENEPEQEILQMVKKQYPNERLKLIGRNGVDINHYEIKRRPKAGDMLKNELALNAYLAVTIDDLESDFLGVLPDIVEITHMQYVSNEFPWGYTAAEVDFVFTLADDGVYRIFIIEMKKDWLNDDSVIQLYLYIPWVVQVINQYSSNPPQDVEVIPIVIGQRAHDSARRPREFNFTMCFISGVNVRAVVKPAIFLKYNCADTYDLNGKSYTTRLGFEDISTSIDSISWSPIPQNGIATSDVERIWVKTKQWQEALD